MSVVSEVLKQSVTEKTLEKGGLFLTLMAVLYIGYNIYETSSEKERDLILNNLTSISQQQLNIQESIKEINENIFESRVKNDLIMTQITNMERITSKFIYYDKQKNVIVIKTPQGDLVTINTIGEQ